MKFLGSFWAKLCPSALGGGEFLTSIPLKNPTKPVPRKRHRAGKGPSPCWPAKAKAPWRSVSSGINHPFWGTTIFGNTHIWISSLALCFSWIVSHKISMAAMAAVVVLSAVFSVFTEHKNTKQRRPWRLLWLCPWLRSIPGTNCKMTEKLPLGAAMVLKGAQTSVCFLWD